MKKLFAAAFCAVFAAGCAALLTSCGKGENIDGVSTERIELYSGEDAASGSHEPTKSEQELYDKVKTYFETYYKTYRGGVSYTTSFDPEERGTYGGDECYIFHSRESSESGDGGNEGFLIAASVDGRSVYGCEPSTGLQGLIWCDGWTQPDFSYFGGVNLSGL